MTVAICSFLFFALFVYRCEANYNYRFFPTYHLGPLISPETKVGWMNDPNGFCVFKGEYHLFYQYNPNSSLVPGIAHWGHAKSKDLLHWEHLPIALYPDEPYDKSGVFSGSALVENDVMYLFYTGNLNHPGESPDHEQHQILATSTDGEHFTKYDNNPIINGADRQPNFRDPKVWKHKNTYYMVLGNSFKNETRGRVLLYASQDKINWKEVSILDESDGALGYMWECPDFFELDGRYVLMFSPQGVEPQGYKYNNLYSTGYMVGTFDYESNLFTAKTGYVELDNGHDFYATQTMLDTQRRRVMVAWMDMWEQNYPEGPDGFTGQMTIPRVLRLRNNRLIQEPIKEIEQALGTKLFSGEARSGTKVKLPNNAGRIQVTSERLKDFTLVIESDSANATIVTISYDYKKGLVTLDRGGCDGVRRTKYRPTGKLLMDVFVDSSSIEVIWGKGEKTMSSRVFYNGAVFVTVSEHSQADIMVVHAIKRTVPEPNPDC